MEMSCSYGGVGSFKRYQFWNWLERRLVVEFTSSMVEKLEGSGGPNDGSFT